LGSIISLFGLLLQAQAATSVTLAWNPSGASGIAGYRLHYGTSSRSYSQTRDLGNTTTTTVSNLLPGQTYYFAVTDYNAAAVESPPSNEVSFTATVPIANGSGIAKDFNNDGQPDLVWEDAANGRLEIWFMKNGTFQSDYSPGTVDPSWHVVGVGDFLGTGQSDLVWESARGAHVIWILNNGVFQYAISLPNVGGGWHVVGAGDFNGGGQADLVWENATTGQRAIWLMKNGVHSSSISLPTVQPQWHIVDH